MELTFAVVPASILPSLNYDLLLEDGIETTRASIDGTLAIVTYPAGNEQPMQGAVFYSEETIYGYLEENYFVWNPNDPE
jgi:hypothetical protein